MKLRNVCLFVCIFTGLLLGILKDSSAVESKKIIFTDTTWTKSGSPYILKEGIVVPNGVTLTIEPGVVVKFDKGLGINVDGTLIAKGTPNEKITFTRNSFDNWGYVFFSDSSTDAVYDTYGDYTAGSILEHCIVEYSGGVNVSNNGAVRLENAHPFINYCTIQNNSASGIIGWSLSGTLIIANTNITNNSSTTGSGGGIDIYSNGTTRILNNTISKNTASSGGVGGINIYNASATTATVTTISNNTIDSNIGSGIMANQYSWSNTLVNISNNIISNNTSSSVGGIYIGLGYGNGTTNFSGNIVYNNTASSVGGGIFAYNNQGTINIINNIIGKNTSGDVGSIYAAHSNYYAGGETNISYNSLVGNSAKNEAAVYCYDTRKDFKYNTITNNKATDDNSCAVWIGNNPPIFNYNNIFGNTTTYELWYGNAKGSYGWLDAKYNWWGTSVEDEVTGKIYDFLDDASYDIVNYSNYDTAIRTDAPISPPTGLTATLGNGQISLSWNANPEPDTAGYKVYWDTNSGYPYAHSKDVGNVTSYTIPNLVANEYYVTVTAYDKDYASNKDDKKTIVNDNQTNGNESWFADEKKATLSGENSPTAITKSATNVTMNTATINGTVNAKGLQTRAWFEYGTSSDSLTNTTSKKKASGNNNKKISVNMSGLPGGATYYYRIVAKNKAGTAYGEKMSFNTTADAKPIATTGIAKNITSNSATLTGTANANGQVTTVRFFYGTQSEYYPYISSTVDISGIKNTSISINITGLSPGTTYYYKIVGENSTGTTYGEEKTFDTYGELKAKHVVIIDIDGLRPKLLSDCLKNGYIKNLAKLFGGNDLNSTSNAIWMKNCRTNFPSLTLPGQATIFTGCYINKHGIYGNQWFNKLSTEKRNYFGFWNIIFEDISNIQNPDLQVKTIYENAAENGLKSLVIWNQFIGKHFDCLMKTGGCDTNFHTCNGCDDEACLNCEKYLKNITWQLPSNLTLPLYITDPYVYDQNMVTKAIESLNENEEVPSIITLYFASVDHVAHCDTSGGEQRIALIVIDKGIGLFLDALKTKLRDSDLKEVVFILVSDHGHTQVKSDEDHQIQASEIGEALKGWYNAYIPNREGGEKNLKTESKSIEESDLVICDNDGMAHFYIKNSMTSDWKDAPDFCQDIIPLAHRLRHTQVTMEGQPNYIMDRNGVDMVLVKNKEEGKYMVYAGDGDVPLCDEIKDLNVYFNSSEEKAINNLFSENSGDVIIMANFDKGYDIYTTTIGYCCSDLASCFDVLYSDHGSILDSDRLITFVICGTPVKGRVISEDTNQVDVAPTIAGMLGFTMPQADGKDILVSH